MGEVLAQMNEEELIEKCFQLYISTRNGGPGARVEAKIMADDKKLLKIICNYNDYPKDQSKVAQAKQNMGEELAQMNEEELIEKCFQLYISTRNGGPGARVEAKIMADDKKLLKILCIYNDYPKDQCKVAEAKQIMGEALAQMYEEEALTEKCFQLHAMVTV